MRKAKLNDAAVYIKLGKLWFLLRYTCNETGCSIWLKGGRHQPGCAVKLLKYTFPAPASLTD